MGLGEIGEGNKQKNKLTDGDSSMVIIRGKGMGEVEEGKGWIKGDGRRLDFGW